MRAVTFQSIERMSSPARYSRTSTNSIPVPLNVDLYSPTNVVLMILRVRISICRSFFRNSFESMEGSGGSGHLDRGQDLLDHVVRCQLLRLGFVREDDAVPQHVGRELLHVLRDHE